MKRTLILLAAALTFVSARAAFQIVGQGGWLESAYAVWSFDAPHNYYHAYYSDGTDYVRIDSMMLRNYDYYGRVDMVGLPAGTYTLKIVPVANGVELPDQALTTGPLDVRAYDRSGFAHRGFANQMGAYNDDGSLRQGARVLYVTAQTAKTVSMDVTTNNKGGKTTYTGVQNIIIGYQKGYETTPLDVRIIGLVTREDLDTIGSKEEGVQIKGKSSYSSMPITIEGIGNDATVSGFGFLVRNCKGVEFRNLGLMMFMDDGISFDTDNSNCWVHNVDIFYGQPGSAADQVKGDGSIDCKADSKDITFSYNHFWDAGKSSLCGMKSEATSSLICYHHNWFDHSDSRHPRVRTMTVHVWNNYYDGVSKYGVGATMGSSVFVESNYFRGTSKPMMISLQGTDAKGSKGTFSGEAGGMIKSYGNVFAERPGSFSYVPHTSSATSFDAYEAAERSEAVPESYVTLTGRTAYNNFDTDPSLIYDYSPDAAADVPSVVTGYYGAGRMQGGDVSFQFASSEDSNSDVIAALKSQLTSYRPSLAGILAPTTFTALPSVEEPGLPMLDLNSPAYDLLGRRSYVLVKGRIYIQNGHKVLYR